jgi:hypothetical protein
LQIKTKIVSCHTSDSKPVKQEVNITVILHPLVFPGAGITYDDHRMTTVICLQFRPQQVVRRDLHESYDCDEDGDDGDAGGDGRRDGLEEGGLLKLAAFLIELE